MKKETRRQPRREEVHEEQQEGSEEMKTLTIFTTAEELIRAFVQARPAGETYPFLSQRDAYVVMDGDSDIRLSGDGASNFDVQGVTQQAFINALAEKCGIRIHFT